MHDSYKSATPFPEIIYENTFRQDWLNRPTWEVGFIQNNFKQTEQKQMYQ